MYTFKETNAKDSYKIWKQSPNASIYTNPEFLSNFVEVLRKVNKSEEAIEIGKRAVKANPNKANAHSNLGLAFYDCEDLIEAEASQRRAIALNPDYDHALNNLGSIAFDNEEYDEAIKYYYMYGWTWRPPM